MKSFQAQALILAATGAVWEVLTDTGNFTVWDSGIKAVSGELRPGSTVRVRIAGSGRRTLRFRVILIPGRTITWTRWLSLGLGRVTRTVSLSDHGGFTHLTVIQTTKGVPPRLFDGTGADTDHILQAFVDAVKFRAELLGHHLHGGLFPTPPHGTPPPHGCAPSAAPARHLSGPHRTSNAATHQANSARGKNQPGS
ncbi:SRPBCC family protein [Pseudarthrobacter sp. NPDC058329]|uniref:SRPBCC family protein n=1 Tax=Pseudarthrobacter sp. NPDC058329 TaxID=3346448 RepID=UPI0036DA52CC